MKKYILLICSAIVVFSMTTCTEEGMEFDNYGGKGLAFTHFVGSSQSLAAKTDAYTATIQVSSTAKSDAARTYTLNVDPLSTAVEGTHYTLSSKTVTIPAGEYAGSVTITANLDNLTPETVTANFSIDSEDFIDYGRQYSVSMYLFFEVSWDWLLGSWIWTDYYMGAPDDQYEVEITKIDDNTIGITNIWDGEMTIEATVDFDNSKIIIKPRQPYYDYWEDGESYGFLYMDQCASDDWHDYSTVNPIIGNCSFDGTIYVERWTPMLHDTGYAWADVFTSRLTRP